jgi:hypothetical protein
MLKIIIENVTNKRNKDVFICQYRVRVHIMWDTQQIQHLSGTPNGGLGKWEALTSSNYKKETILRSLYHSD